MTRISLYIVSALFWLCLGERSSRREEPASHGRAWYGNDVSYQPSKSPRIQASPQHCSTGTWYGGAIPKGFRSEQPGDIVFHLLFQGQQMTKSQCLRACCELGPLYCQHLWFFKTNCLAVACTPPTSINCSSQQLVSTENPSTVSAYVSIIYSRPDSPPTPAVTAVTSSVQHLTATISPSDVITQDSDILLSASSSQQQGALDYTWELLSVEPTQLMEEAFISGSRTDTLHLSALSPGIYTIQLTVRDSSGQTDTTTTTVTIIPAPNEPHLVAHENVTPNTTMSMTTDATADVQRTTRLPIKYNSTRTTPHNQANPTPTTSVTTADHIQPLPSVAVLSQEEGEFSEEEASSSDDGYGLFVKVGVPVLAIVVLILGISGCIVAASSCVLFHSEKRKYRYRRLNHTHT